MLASALAACVTGCLCLRCLYSRNNQLYKQSGQAKATSYTSSPSTSRRLYKKCKHRQPVTLAAQAQAASYTSSASTGNQLLTRRQIYTQRKHRQPVIHTATAQATSSARTSNQLHRQPVTQATSYMWQRVLGSWIACITACLCFGCVCNWLPVLALPVQPQQSGIQANRPSKGNQLYTQRQHRQPVIQTAPAIQTTQSRATSYTTRAITDKR